MAAQTARPVPPEPSPQLSRQQANSPLALSERRRPSKTRLAAGKKFRGFSLKGQRSAGQPDGLPEDAQRIEEEVIRDAFERGQVVVPLHRPGDETTAC